MRLLVTHGYMLSGSGSNVYVQNLCRALVRAGHEVHLLCQEPRPLDYDFVGGHYTVSEDGMESRGERTTAYAGRCSLYLPDIGDLLPVYVYDDYPGWRVKTFLDLAAEEFDEYVRRNVAAVRTVLDAGGAEAVVTNHSVPGPLISAQALAGTGVPYLSIVHGSALQYVARKSAFYRRVAHRGLRGAERVLALSTDSAATVVEDFPELAEKTLALPGGVDTERFRPDAWDLRTLENLAGGPGRGPEQVASLHRLLERGPTEAGDLAEGLRSISSSYDPRSHDRDAGERLGNFLEADSPLVIYVGKLIHSKGVHSLLSAFARFYRRMDARLLVVGFGTFREALEALTLALGGGDRRTLGLLANGGRLFEGGDSGPLEHRELAKLLPAADAGVVPSIFPESFGLVAAELAASGVPPFVADHSGLREAGDIVGRGLPFDLRVGMDGFEENLARALAGYLERPRRERAGYGEVVRRNSVEYLGWDGLAERVVELSAQDSGSLR